MSVNERKYVSKGEKRQKKEEKYDCKWGNYVSKRENMNMKESSPIKNNHLNSIKSNS